LRYAICVIITHTSKTHKRKTRIKKTRSKLGTRFNTFKRSRNYFFLAFLAGAFLAGAFLAAGFFLAAAIIFVPCLD
jgi:hypothetical protein